MKIMLLVLLLSTPAAAQVFTQPRGPQPPAMRVHLDNAGIKVNCYPYTADVKVHCQGQSEWQVEVQQLFNTFTMQDSYTNSLGVQRTLDKDISEGHGLAPWVRGYVLKEYEKRGVKF
jgi:hypothetical protein